MKRRRKLLFSKDVKKAKATEKRNKKKILKRKKEKHNKPTV